MQTHRTPKELGDLLHPHIAKREWDIVAQLAFQLKGRGFQGDADELLDGLLSAAFSSGEEQVWNFLLFAACSLEFMVPTPPLRRRITDECLMRALNWGEARKRAGINADTEEIPAHTIGSLLAASLENRSVIADGLRSKLIERIQSTTGPAALVATEMALCLSYSLHILRTSLAGGESKFWDNISDEIRDVCAEHILALAKVNPDTAIDCRWREKISTEELIQWHGPEVLFQERPFVFFAGIRISIAATLTRYVTVWPSDQASSAHFARVFTLARDLGRILLSTRPHGPSSTASTQWVL